MIFFVMIDESTQRRGLISMPLGHNITLSMQHGILRGMVERPKRVFARWASKSNGCWLLSTLRRVIQKSMFKIKPTRKVIPIYIYIWSPAVFILRTCARHCPSPSVAAPHPRRCHCALDPCLPRFGRTRCPTGSWPDFDWIAARIRRKCGRKWLRHWRP